MSNALHSVELWLIALVITVSILAGFGMFSRWCIFSPAVSRRKLDQLHVGMSMDEVARLLGRARDESRQSNGVIQWTYGPRVKRHVLTIEFNANSTVGAFAHGVPGAGRTGRSVKDS
jgi:outer membrane protein assembly factor BamE (lipoprotein component of BamABCDE complex)